VFTPLSGWHCKLRPNTEGAEHITAEQIEDHDLQMTYAALQRSSGVDATAALTKGMEPCDQLRFMLYGTVLGFRT
jgi:hypothetical protein